MAPSRPPGRNLRTEKIPSWRILAPSWRFRHNENSVLQDGGRNFANAEFRPPGRRTEIESSVLKLRPPGRRTEIEDGGQDGARFPEPRTEDGAVLRFRPPGRRTEIEDGGQDGGRFSDPRTEFIPSSRTEDGARTESYGARTESDGIYSVL